MTDEDAKMRRPTFDNRITVGNLLTGVLIIGTVIGLWYQQKGTVDLLSQRVDQIEKTQVADRLSFADQVNRLDVRLAKQEDARSDTRAEIATLTQQLVGLRDMQRSQGDILKTIAERVGASK